MDDSFGDLLLALVAFSTVIQVVTVIVSHFAHKDLMNVLSSQESLNKWTQAMFEKCTEREIVSALGKDAISYMQQKRTDRERPVPSVVSKRFPPEGATVMRSED